MRVIDSYPEMLALYQRMNCGFDRELWKDYAKGIAPGFAEKLEKDSASYDFDSQILPVLTLAVKSGEKLQIAHASFLTATDGLAEKAYAITGTNVEADVIFYLGLCNGAGWATELNGRKAILLGVEKIIELGFYGIDSMAGLIYHELGHIWHDIAGNTKRQLTSQREKGVWQLYREGLAVYFEQLLTRDAARYHQNKGGWLSWCDSNRRELNKEYLRRLQANESVREFFGDWNSYRGRSDVGYYLGCEFVKWLSREYSLSELSGLKVRALYESFNEYAVSG